MLRHPVDIIISTFWHRKVATWEGNFDAGHINQTMEEFIESKNNGRDWLSFSLAAATHAKVTPFHRRLISEKEVQTDALYLAAREILFSKFIVGFVDDMNYSLKLIFSSFGWPFDGVFDHMKSFNVNPMRSHAERGLMVTAEQLQHFRQRLVDLNYRDIKIYSEARSRYDEFKAKRYVQTSRTR